MDQSLLAAWDNFYVIVGSAAAGLTGLTFVVIALVRDARRVQPGGLRAFVTPTIVHFSGVLALAAFLSMPHLYALPLSGGFFIAGAAGLIYSISIGRGIAGQQGYEPVWEDWIWNVIAPFLSYGSLLIVAGTIWYWPGPSLYAVALASLTMLFAGIHNAWDIAVWMTMSKGDSASDREPGK
jgi:hypothetical protein